MEALKFLATQTAALAVYLVGLALGLGAFALMILVGYDDFGLRSQGLALWFLVSIAVGTGIIIAADNIASEIVA